MIIRSGLPASCGAAGWTCRSPNSRPKARCWSGVMCWSRKKITQVLGERAVHLVLLAIGKRLAEVDAADLRADDRRQLVDGDGLVRRTFVGRVPVAGTGVASQRSLHGSLLLHLDVGTMNDLAPALFLGAVKAANSAGLISLGDPRPWPPGARVPRAWRRPWRMSALMLRRRPPAASPWARSSRSRS